MKSRNIGYIPEIDHLRLLAALLVFGFHFFHFYVGSWLPYPQHPFLGLITEGHTGVSLFFVLSGFIFMTIALASDEIRYGSFLRNRILRIAPLFVIVFVVAVSIGRNRFQATDLLYLFITNLGDAPTSWHFATGPAWSISVEFAFYLVFPFLAAFTRERGVRYLFQAIGLMFIIKLAAYFAAENSRHMLYSTLVGRFDQFLIGMLAAILYGRMKERLERHGKLLLGLSLLLVFLGAAFQARWLSYMAPEPKQPLGVVWGTVEAVLWAGVVIAYLAARPPWPVAIGRLLGKGGEWSFSFYMWHAMIIYLAHELLGPLGGTGGLALAFNGAIVLAATLLFSALSYGTIERPFLEMRQRYTRSGG
ncbi:acyltransferase [uncultured Rhizobium sp.]|uniref:acyltransferase family protein n=1 Tax=uncultured Rhizobium sp. TaxID=155567 RepID=UPI001AD10B05|nr:acyltransferase [uncultured Rhizobium sp.]MBN9034338.1 acyltransferase [Hyphomicrobiales bacterium]